jgi:hypothetical protein
MPSVSGQRPIQRPIVDFFVSDGFCLVRAGPSWSELPRAAHEVTRERWTSIDG